MYLLDKIIELIILRYNRIMCYEWTQETTWRVVSISTKYLKKKKEKKKKEKNAKLLHLKIKKEVKRENSLYSSKSQHPISTFDRLLPWMVQTTIMIKKSPAIGNDDAPVKISTLKKKKKIGWNHEEGERGWQRGALLRKKAYKRQWPKCALVSRFSRSGKLFLDSDRLDIRAQISAVPSLSLSLCPFKRKVHGWNVAAVYFDLWREIEKKGR